MPTVFEGPFVQSPLMGFTAPDGAHLLVDLSPNSTPGSKGLFLSQRNLGFDYRIIDNADHYVWDQLTRIADPDGLDTAKPLVPSTSGLELYFGSVGLVHREKFKWGKDPHTNRLADVLQRDFRSAFGVGLNHSRKVLDWWCERYGVADWRGFVPPDLRPHVPGRLPHETTIADSFNRANGSIGSSSEGWSWTARSGGFNVSSNQVVGTTYMSAQNEARAESDLSSSDHYAQVTVASLSGGSAEADGGAVARMDSGGGAITRYSAFLLTGAGLNRIYLQKLVAGSLTNITFANVTLSIPESCRVECSGSTVKGYQGGVERASVTDTSISGGTRCGIFTYYTGDAANPVLDDFTAADLAAGGISIPVVMHHRRMQGMS